MCVKYVVYEKFRMAVKVNGDSQVIPGVGGECVDGHGTGIAQADVGMVVDLFADKRGVRNNFV